MDLSHEMRLCALELHAAMKRGDRTSQLLHGAALADLVLIATADQARDDACSDGGPENDLGLTVAAQEVSP